MLSTISLVIKTGDFLPGIAAVVMIIFTSFACSANNLISASMNSLLIVLAYPPLPVPSSSKFNSKYSAPMLCTSSRTPDLVSKARTIAPKLWAQPTAESPATPAPITKTLAGGIFPAAVICPVKRRPKLCAASVTAL